MARWAACGVVGQIRDQFRKRIRREMGRSPGAVATVVDSQSVKAAETVGKDSRGYDAAKKVNGRKRHLVVDTKGLPLFVMVTPADVTDRDAAKEVLFHALPTILVEPRRQAGVMGDPRGALTPGPVRTQGSRAGLTGVRAARPVLLPVGEGWWVCGQPVQLGTAGELPVQLLGVLPEIGEVVTVIVPFSR